MHSFQRAQRPTGQAIFWLTTLAGLCAASLAAADDLRLSEKTVVRFAAAAEGAKVLGTDDDYTARLSRFDLQSRLHTDRAVTVAELKQFQAGEVRDWSEGDRAKVAAVVVSLAGRLADFDLPLPGEILLVSTTGREEADAAYTRAQSIVLPRSKTAGRPEALEGLFAHELFHVLSRNNPALREKLYAIVGFHPCPEVVWPEKLLPRRISNPDAPRYDFYLELGLEGRTVSAVPVLFSRTDTYDARRGESFFSVMQFRLLQVEKRGERFEPVLKDGEPVLIDPQTNHSFHEQIGRNTGYIIHPDEILADNFQYLVMGRKDYPTPRIPEAMKTILARPKK